MILGDDGENPMAFDSPQLHCKIPGHSVNTGAVVTDWSQNSGRGSRGPWSCLPSRRYGKLLPHCLPLTLFFVGDDFGALALVLLSHGLVDLKVGVVEAEVSTARLKTAVRASEMMSDARNDRPPALTVHASGLTTGCGIG